MPFLPSAPTRYIDYLAAVWCMAIIYGSLLPLPELTEMPGTDKAHHLIGYGVLAFLATWNRRTPASWLTITALIILLGGVIELVQPYVNRYGELTDFAANTIGALIGLAGSILLQRLRTKPRHLRD